MLHTLWTPILFSILSSLTMAASTLPPVPAKLSDASRTEIAVFAGGCFWSMESAFEKTDGVIEAISGYTGGRTKDPGYHDVSSEDTGHVEAVQVLYDPKKISYAELLEVFWRNINPTDSGGQFFDRGPQYTTAIFFENGDQRKLAEASKESLKKSGRFNKPIVTPIKKASKFYPAEREHQNYYKTNESAYLRYRKGSGRNDYFEKTWGKDYYFKARAELKTL